MSKFVNQVGDIAAPYFIEAVVRGTVTRATGDIVNAVSVFNFRRLTNSPIFDPVDIASVFKAEWEPVYKAIVTPDFAFGQEEVRGMDDPTAATAVEPSSTVGTLAQDLYAPDTAVYKIGRASCRERV